MGGTVDGRGVRRICAALLAIVCLVGQARAIAVPSVGSVDVISSSPLITVQHCWTGGDVYDVNVTLALPDNFSTVSLQFPDVEKADSAMGRVPDGPRAWIHSMSNMVRIGYGKERTLAGPVYVIDKGTTSGLLCDQILIRPGETRRFLLKFRLPPLPLTNGTGSVANPADVPATISLLVDLDWYGGCREGSSVLKSYPFCNRELLISLGTQAS